MPLVNCPECNKEISDQALSCPNCGMPRRSQSVQPGNFQTNDHADSPPIPESKSSSSAIPAILIILVIAILIWIADKGTSEDKTPSVQADSTNTMEDTGVNTTPDNSTNGSAAIETVTDYSGTYQDMDESTGWETSIEISGSSFTAQTLATRTGEVIASDYGKLSGTLMIDQYGQNVGTVSKYSASIKFGEDEIPCKKIN